MDPLHPPTTSPSWRPALHSAHHLTPHSSGRPRSTRGDIPPVHMPTPPQDASPSSGGPRSTRGDIPPVHMPAPSQECSTPGRPLDSRGPPPPLPRMPSQARRQAAAGHTGSPPCAGPTDHRKPRLILTSPGRRADQSRRPCANGTRPATHSPPSTIHFMDSSGTGCRPTWPPDRSTTAQSAHTTLLAGSRPGVPGPEPGSQATPTVPLTHIVPVPARDRSQG
jgi:hypothetical protein